jgi:ADP-ribosyl-[dinitrogen reductase] hydrolase
MSEQCEVDSRALRGALLGTALGDALGLPYEGMSAAQVAARGGALDRFALWGRTGFVSDDTEQSALLVESVVGANGDVALSVQRFRAALLGWFLRLPFGIGLGTLRACLRIALGYEQSGVRSAGNGAAMRSAALGVLFADDEARRRAAARELAGVTHSDPRAVEGALYVAELASLCTLAPREDRGTLALRALCVVRNRELREAIEGAVLSAGSAHEPRRLPNQGYVVHTLEIACFAFVRSGHGYAPGVRAAIRRGGDTDTNAAIVGAWLGILHGPEALPRRLLAQLSRGPFGLCHLATLGPGRPLPRWSRSRALLRNLALMPVVVAHGVLRLLRAPWGEPGLGEKRVVHSQQ